MTLVDNRDHPKQFALTSYGIVQQTIINIRGKNTRYEECVDAGKMGSYLAPDSVS